MLFRGEDSSSSWLLIISSTDSFLRARESRSYVELRSGPVSANCNSPKYQTIVMYSDASVKPSPSPPYAGRCIVASRLRCQPCDCGYIVRGLQQGLTT